MTKTGSRLSIHHTIKGFINQAEYCNRDEPASKASTDFPTNWHQSTTNLTYANQRSRQGVRARLTVIAVAGKRVR